MLYIGSRNQTNKKRFTDDDDGFLDDLGDVGSEFVKGIAAGTDQLQGLIGGGGRALIGSILDDDEMFSNGMAYYNEQMAEAAENAAEIGSIEDIEGFGDFVNYSAFVVGNVIPSLIGGGGVGAAGGMVAKRAAMSAAGRSLAKNAAGQLTKKQAANMYAASTVGREALAKRGLKGQMGGAFAFSAAAGGGESFTRILDETGEEAALTAIITGIASGGLDAVTPMRALKRILPQEQFKDAAEEVAGAVYRKRGVFSRALREAGKSGAAESVTETMQEIVQNGALEVVRGMGEDLEDSFIERMLDEGKLSQYKNAAVAGLVGGAGMGAFTGAIGQDPDTIEPTERQLQIPAPDQDSEAAPETTPEDDAAARAAQRREQVIQNSRGLPQKRREIPREDPSAVRAAAQQDVADKSLPAQREQKTEEQATASRESIQAQIAEQVASLPKAREKAKQIIKEITEGQRGQGSYRNDGVGEKVTITPPDGPVSTTEVSGALPDPAAITPPMKDLVGQDVEYNGNKGLLIEKDDGYYVSTQDNGDVLVESGLNKSPTELGIVPVSGNLKFENDFEIDTKTKKFNLRGEDYTLTRIIRDADGNALSLAVRDSKGKRKTIRTKSVVDRADAQMTPAPDFSQIQVEMDDLPAAVQKMLINESDPENIPDMVSAQEAISAAANIDDDLAGQVTQVASNRIAIGPNATKYQGSQKFTETVRDHKVTKISEAISEVNKSQGKERTGIDEAKIRNLLDVEDMSIGDGTVLSGAGTSEGGKYSDQVAMALVDLFDAGMPKSFLSNISGLRVHSELENPQIGLSDGSYSRSNGFVSINKNLLNLADKASETGSSNDANLRFVLAHELGHAFDVTTDHTQNSPEFMIEVDGMSPDNVTLDMGEVMHELASNYQSGTELGKEMAYPFGYSFDWLMNASADKTQNKLNTIRMEAFAQAFAVFHSSPDLLEQQAPLTYNYMKNILQTAPPEGRRNAKDNADTQEENSSPDEVRRDVQPSTQSRDTQVQVGDGDRGDGGSGPDARQASEGMGGQSQQEDGNNTGRPVQLERTPVVLKATDKKPTFKKGENHEDTGEYIVTFADGDRYTLYFDDDAKDAGDEVYFTSEDGKVAALDGVLGETKQETIDELIAHRQKLIDAGENSYNTPLNPEVSSDTLFKGYNLVTDHPEGQLKLTDLRKKFRKLEDNQFDNLVERLTDPELDSEELMIVQDGVISHPETVQQVEEERLAEERMIAEEAEFENDLNLLSDDDMLFAPFSRVPEPDESSPVLPMGKVEQSLSDLLAENPNPTSEQLGSIVGAPKKRKGKESVEDVDVRPVTLDELRGYVEDSLSKSDNLKWYDDFGKMFRDLVGDANLDEASVIFGITSAQNAAENNLAETLHIMSLARKFDPVKQRKQFELAVKATTRPDGQKLKITGKQITAIGDLYANGDFEGGIKTTTYMQMVADRGRNEYNPFSVQDVHMSRVFGFRKKDFDKKSGALVDAAKVSGENEYRYAQYLTSVLAEEFGMTPNQMQATLWFYAKDKLTPKNKGDEDKAKKKLEKLKNKAEAEGVEFDENAPRYGDGTPESSALYAAPEIQVIKDMIADGSFDTASSIADSLSDGVRPRNKPAQKTTPFSTVNEREGLMDLARARSPKLIASAVAGKGRGLAFPDDTPIETLVQYNQDVMAAIVDDGGQIPILRELGIPHEIEESAGTFTGYEPSIMIRLLGGNLETANKLAPLLGDALLQDSVITSQAVYAEAGLPAFVVVKKDGSDFSREDAMALAESMNPSKDPDGINFNQPMNDTLMFLDSRSMKEGFEYTELHAKEFYFNLINQLGGDYSVGTITTQGDYHGSDQYREAIEGAWNRETPSGSQNIYDRTNASLYEPVRKVYNEYAEKLGIPKREAQSLDLLSSPPSLFSRGVKQDPSAATFSGKMDTKHGYRYDPSDGDSPVPNFVASKDFKGFRYDGDGGTFGSDGVYLEDASSPAFFNQKSMSQFKPQRRVNVEASFDKAFVFTPATVQQLTSVIGVHPKDIKGAGRGAQIVSLLKEKGYDGLIVKDFKSAEMSDDKQAKKQLKREGMGAFDDDLVQPQVFAFYPEKLKVDADSMELAQDFLSSPPSSDRLQRARDMGFNTDTVYYHGTDQEFSAFSRNKLGANTEADSALEATFFASRKKTAETYSRGKNPNQETSRRRGGSPKVIEAYLKLENPLTYDMKNTAFRDDVVTRVIKSAKDAGNDGVIFANAYDYNSAVTGRVNALLDLGYFKGEDIVAVFNTNQIRSVDADFNPAMADSSDLLFSPPSKPVGKPNANVIPEVNAAYQKFKVGEISQQDFDTVVLSTISEYDFVPTPATYDEMFGALNKNKKQKINIEIQDGEVVGLRLDIPAYTDHGVWVPTIHGDKTSHRATASITGVRFGDDKQPAKAQKVMEGGHKSPFAQMRGAFVNRTDAENEALAKEALNDPDWTQIGFDPRRHSYFYDRKTGQPILSASEVIQVGPLVLAKNAKSEGKTSSDFLYSPPSPTSEEANAARNAAIREEKKTVDKATGWVKKTFKRQLTSRGLLNEQVFQAKIARDGEFGAAEIDTRMYLNSYDKAVKDANLSEEQTALLSEAIATPLDQLNKMDLPDAVKQAIGGMRKYIDKMSIDYAQVVADQALALVENGKGEAAAAKIDLLNTIASKRGKYLNRSYQVFDDPKWANKVPKSVIDNARTFLESNGAQNADRIINTILKTGTAFDGLSNFISEGKLGSKDLSILKKKKDIAPEILALMGEYTDPRINFVKTATKVSRLLWNHRFLERVKFEGQRDGFLFTAEDAPTDAYVQIAPDSSDAMNPLNGLYTTPELAQGFEDSMDLGSNVAWVQKWQQVNSVVKYGKTVIAPTTVARNFMSASLFTIANGHFNWAKAGASLRSLDGYFSSKEGDATAYLREIRRLGVVYDSPYAGELTKALEDFSQGTELDNKVRAVDGLKDKAVQKSKGFLDLMAKNYQYGDDFWKIIGFENMVDVLMDNKGLTREQAMPLAAERIRDTYPTYSLIGKGVKDLRRFPLVGTFVSFPAEIVRTSFNMFKYLKQDMADPDMKGHAMAKVAGMSAVSFGIYALQDAAMRAFDVDEEEQEAIRLMSPTWSENSNILPTGRDDDGNLEYIDLTYLDPYAYFKKPINALMRDQPTEDAIVQAGRELLTPFLGVDIATGTALELYNNEKVSGGRIWNPADTPTNKLSAATEHLMKGAGPAVIQNVTRTGKAINGDVSKSGKRYELEDELKAWVGFRVTTFDPKISLHFKAYEFNEDKRNASSLLTSTFRDPNQLDEGELVNAFERASAARKEGYERMIKLVSAARKSGLNNTQLMMVLRSNGVTKKDARALIAGNPATWEMSDSTLKNSVKKSDLLFGESTGKEFQDRWKIIQQMLREEAR